MIDATIFLGEPQDFKGICKVYPAKVKDVVSNPDYNAYMALLCSSQEEIEDLLTNFAIAKEQSSDMPIPTPLEFILTNCYMNQEVLTKTIAAFKFFLHENVLFLYDQKKILIGNLATELTKDTDLSKLRYLDETNFFDFQNFLRGLNGLPKAEPYKPSEDPRIRRIKAKARYRDKIKAKSNKGLSLGDSLVAICCMGLGISPLTIGELSYAAVPILIETYQRKEKYELDIQSILAGADSKKIKPIYWIGEHN